jgi:hypothetical protein
VLALADTRKRHRALLLAQCQVNHRRDGETAFRGESHDVLGTAILDNFRQV